MTSPPSAVLQVPGAAVYNLTATRPIPFVLSVSDTLRVVLHRRTVEFITQSRKTSFRASTVPRLYPYDGGLRLLIFNNRYAY